MYRFNRHILSGSRIFTFRHVNLLLRFSALFLNSALYSEASLSLCHSHVSGSKERRE